MRATGPQPIAAADALAGLDGVAELAQPLDVTAHAALGHPELPRELRTRPHGTRLEQPEELEQSCRRGHAAGLAPTEVSICPAVLPAWRHDDHDQHLADLLVDQLDWHWRHQLRPRLDGVGDEEYRWEPAAGTSADAAASTPRSGRAGATSPSTSPSPSRPTASHHDRVAARAPDRRRDRGPQRLPLRRSALRLRGLGLRGSGGRGDRAARRGLRRLDRGRARSGRGGARPPVRTGRGPWADRSMAELVLHVNREVIHHGAEIALLRDLWADGLGSSPREDAAHARHAPTRRQRTRRPRRLRRPAARRVPLRRLRSHRRARPPRAPCPWAPW